ncbi:MAG: AsmA family protein [Legionella sp.]|nr:AsmA family protein [Legionella sp.]
MTRLKKIGLVFILLLTLATSVLWILIKSIKPELIKDYVNTQLTKLTEQPSRVNGDISWQFFPSPGVRLTSIQIGEINQGDYTATLENARFNLKLMPLLQGKFIFSELDINGFNVQINPAAQAIDSKLSKLKQTSSLPIKGETHPLTLDEKANNIAEKFAIQRILLSRGQVTFLKDQKKITLSNLQVGAEKFNLKKNFFPLQLRAGLDIQSEGTSKIKAAINFKGRMAFSNVIFSDLLDTLKRTPIKGQLFIEQMHAGSLNIDKATANVKTKAGTLLLTPITLNLYNGESIGDLSYEFVSKKLLFNQTATNLDAQKLGYDLTKKDNFKGSIDFSIHTQANFEDPQWKESMVSRGNLTIKEGRLPFVNLESGLIDMANMLSEVILTQRGQTNLNQKDTLPQLPSKQLADLTAFSGEIKCKILTLQYVWNNDRLQSDSFVLQTDKLQLTGDAAINFSNDSLDSHLFATLSASDEQIEKIQASLGGSFPLVVRGTLTSPVVLPDVKRIMPVVARMGLEDTISKAIEKAKKRFKLSTANAKMVMAQH